MHARLLSSSSVFHCFSCVFYVEPTQFSKFYVIEPLRKLNEKCATKNSFSQFSKFADFQLLHLDYCGRNTSQYLLPAAATIK